MAQLKSISLASAILVAGLTLSACGSGAAVANARLACKQVAVALATQKKSEVPGLSTAQVDTLQSLALAQLQKASSFAATATTSDGSWNTLQTAINESNRVPLKYLTASLTRLCQVANSDTPYL
jgi:hypothetical protein